MNSHNGDDTESSQLYRNYYTKQDSIEVPISGELSIQIRKFQLELDQEREGEYYKILLPQCSTSAIGQ